MAPRFDGEGMYGRIKNWNVSGCSARSLLLLGLAVFGLSLLLGSIYDLTTMLWPLWTVGTGVVLVYLAWQTEHWPGVRESSLGIEAAVGGAALGVLALGVKGILGAGLLDASNFFLIRLGAILTIGVFIGAALYFWFYLFTTKAKDRTAETMRLFSIAALGITLWVTYFFASLDIVFALAHFVFAIWAGVIASGQAVAEDSVARQVSD